MAFKDGKNSFWKVLGPGLIWAGAAIGVSHLVQSTRAGAAFGFQLLGIVILANVLKYPFFQFGPRYAAASGESLVDGYKRKGKWTVILFLFLTLGTMFTITAAVTSVTVGILSSVFDLQITYLQTTLVLLFVCGVIIMIGRYRTLDRIMKVVVVILAASTIVAIFMAFSQVEVQAGAFVPRLEWNVSNIAFIVALAGWMPSAIDISVWNSLWTLAKIKDTGYRPSKRETLLDFNIGYIGTAVMSVVFLSLGALVMHGKGLTFEQSGVGFARQFLSLYTESIGAWSYPIIALAAIATMFSTTLTVLDAYPRVLMPVSEALLPRLSKWKENKYMHAFWLLLVMVGTLMLVSVFSSRMKVLVDIATTLSFVTAPVLGYLNLRVMTADHIDKVWQPGIVLRWFTWTAIFILSGFSVYFLYLKLF